jgi:peptide/nickel transport system permease protein
MISIDTPKEPGGAGAPGFTSALAGSPKALFALAIIVTIVCCALFSPLLAPYDPNLQSLVGRLQPPLSAAADGHFHLLGTDHLGRDMLSRLIYGARISLLVGIGASAVAGTIGVLFGLVSGFFTGLIDDASCGCARSSSRCPISCSRSRCWPSSAPACSASLSCCRSPSG